MKKVKILITVLTVFSLSFFSCKKAQEIKNTDTLKTSITSFESDEKVNNTVPETRKIKLPDPRTDGTVSLEKTLSERRSIREYRKEPLELSEISQLLWSAQGITNKSSGKRTSPSAGALFPLEIYVVAGNVNDLEDGIYKYRTETHELILVKSGDNREDIYTKVYSREWLKNVPSFLIFAGVYERTTGKYGERGKRYVHIEVGHSAQNVLLQAVAMNLGTVVMGAFDDTTLKKVIGMTEDEQPFYIIPVGRY